MDTILLTGRTGLFPAEALAYIGEEYQVLLTGEKTEAASFEIPDNVRWMPVIPSDADFKKVFEVGDVRAVWHICGCADGGRSGDESVQIETILRLCDRYSVPRMVILTEPGDTSDYRTLIRTWSSPDSSIVHTPVDIAVVLLPLLTGTGTRRGRISRIFNAMRKGKTVALHGKSDTRISILDVSDLTTLLLRMTKETWFRPGIYTADGSPSRLETLRELLLTLCPDAMIEYTSAGRSGEKGKSTKAWFRVPVADPSICDGSLGELYQMPVSTDWARTIASEYGDLLEKKKTSPSLRDKGGVFLKKFGPFAGAVLDLAVTFIIAEYLSRITSESVYFKIVDVRLIFVILMGMMHGLAVGFAAAFLECAVLVIRYSQVGISGLLLFYNVENWIPFVYYLTAGMICGYIHQKHKQELHSISAENELIRNKYLFLNEAYRASIQDKHELRDQVLNEEDSYNSLYGAMRQMSQRTPEAVCVEAVGVLRRILDNDTIGIYQMEESGKEARLLPVCREGAARQVLRPADCPGMFAVIGRGDTWKNTAMLENTPMYASMLRFRRVLHREAGEQEIVLVVTVEQARQNQLNLWYMNHFTIMCGLLKDSLESASLRERILA